MSDEIDPSRETLVFPSRTVSRQYQKYFMKTRRLNAVDGSRFIEWDRFTEKLRRVPDGEFRSIKPIMRRLFTEMLIEENISRPFLNYLIPAPAAGKSRSYRGILNQALLYFSGNNSERKPPAAGGHLLSGRCFLRCIGLRNNRFTELYRVGIRCIQRNSCGRKYPADNGSEHFAECPNVSGKSRNEKYCSVPSSE